MLKPDTPDCMVPVASLSRARDEDTRQIRGRVRLRRLLNAANACFAFARGRRLGRRPEAAHDPKGTAVVAIGTTEQSSITDFTHIVTFATFVTEGPQVQRVLTHIGEPAQAPSIATRRGRFGALDLPQVSPHLWRVAPVCRRDPMRASCQIPYQCAVWRWTCSAPSTCYDYW